MLDSRHAKPLGLLAEMNGGTSELKPENGLVMSQNQTYKKEKLCELINSGSLRLPLSHTRALEVIAKLEGEPDWNTALTKCEGIETLKDRARVLRTGVNSRIKDGQLSITNASSVIEEVSAVIAIHNFQSGNPGVLKLKYQHFVESPELLDRIEAFTEDRLKQFLSSGVSSRQLQPIVLLFSGVSPDDSRIKNVRALSRQLHLKIIFDGITAENWFFVDGANPAGSGFKELAKTIDLMTRLRLKRMVPLESKAALDLGVSLPNDIVNSVDEKSS